MYTYLSMFSVPAIGELLCKNDGQDERKKQIQSDGGTRKD